MFTGIIESVLEIQETKVLDSGLEISLKNPFESVRIGESIAVNGVCLTTTEVEQCLRFFISQETCKRSNLGSIKAGDLVNIERALILSDRLSGHIVQGHIDGIAYLMSVQKIGEANEMTVKITENLSRYIVEKGSVSLNGISLTVNSIQDFLMKVMIIPHTWENTNLHRTLLKQSLNLEVDVVAKYLEKFLK